MEKIRIDRSYTHSVRVFKAFTGDSLENLTRYEAWDLVTILCQAVSDAHVSGFEAISTDGLAEMLKLDISANTQKCIESLNGFPEAQVNSLMIVLLKALR